MVLIQNRSYQHRRRGRIAELDSEKVQCKRTGLRSQFRAGVGPLLPLESERCPAFLRPGLMVRANALHYALRIRTLLSIMQRFGVLRERQTHKPMAGLREGKEPRRHGKAKEVEG